MHFGLDFDYAHYDQIDLWNGVCHSVARLDPFIVCIYFAPVFGVSVLAAPVATAVCPMD